MGCDGKTIAMPSLRVRGFPAIRRYLVIEGAGFIWVWLGDPEKANVTSIPVEIDDMPCTTSNEGDDAITCRFVENIQAPPF